MYSVEGIYLFYAYIYLNAIKKEGISTPSLYELYKQQRSIIISKLAFKVLLFLFAYAFSSSLYFLSISSIACLSGS